MSAPEDPELTEELQRLEQAGERGSLALREMVDYPANLPGTLDLGHRHFARRDGKAILWWHDCTVEHVSWGWIGDLGDGRRSGHIIVEGEPVPLTVQGSLICEACGDHGYIELGRWRSLRAPGA